MSSPCAKSCLLKYRKIVFHFDIDEQVIEDLRAIVRNPSFVPTSPQEICNLIFHTCYMGTENSGPDTQSRAKELAARIGCYHLDIKIDSIVQSFLSLFSFVTGKMPQFRAFGGSNTENLALQNVQARSRMVVAYLFAQLLLWSRGLDGSLLVLGSSNVDETYQVLMIDYVAI